jgi:uncharacterized protein YwgA
LLKRRIERLMNRIKRLAVLVFTLKKGKEQLGVVGHTLMQKLFYLLQCGEGVELGYKYKLHYYGPYSRELWSDLNLLANEKVVNIEANPNGYGYKIELLEGENTNLLLNEVDKNIKEKIFKLLKLLGKKRVENLEAMATLHYVYSDLRKREKEFEDEKIINLTQNLKPHLTNEVLLNAIERLRENQLIS